MLRRLTLIVVFGLLLTSFSVPIFAQGCDTASISSDFIDFLAQFNPESTMAERFTSMTQWLRGRQARCNTNTSEPVFSFSSAEEGKQPLLGPLAIPGGYYRVRALTDGSFIARLETTEGKCDTSSVSSMFAFSEGEGSKGAEVLLHSINCHAFITISNINDDWTLEFYRVSTKDAVPVSNVYSSEDLGIAPLIGPIVFEDGYYRATLTTDGYMIMYVHTAAGTCGPKTSLFNLSAGEGSEGAEALITSKECIGYLSIGNNSLPWTLTIEPIE